MGAGRYANKKGDRGEIQVVKSLQAWWRQLEPKAVFARTPDSGAWSTAKGGGFRATGDIQVDEDTKLWPFCVEVKWRKVVTDGVIGLFIQGTSRVANAYWESVCEDAKKDGLMPLLAMRGNRMIWWVAFKEPKTGVPRVCLLDELVARDPREFLIRRAKVRA